LRSPVAQPSSVKWNFIDYLNTLIAKPEIVREITLSDELPTPSLLRGLRWRVFFKLFPENVSDWTQKVTQTRGAYIEALSKLVSTKCKSLINNFYNADEWNNFYKVSDEAKEILLDLERTYSDINFFREHQTTICRILLVFANEHQEFKYMQGMNELIAPLFYVVFQDSVYLKEKASAIKEMKISESYPFPNVFEKNNISPLELLNTICSESYAEADTYALFCELMKVAGDWFDSQFISDGSYNDIRVVAKCHQILLRLQVKDGELSKAISRIRMNPPLYLVKWIRILFAQVFPFDELLSIWDAIFAHSTDCELIEYICTGILVYIRDELITNDVTDAMNALFSFKGKSKSKEIINLALISSVTSSPFFSGYYASDEIVNQQRDFINSAKRLGFSTPKEIESGTSACSSSSTPLSHNFSSSENEISTDLYRKTLKETADKISIIVALINENKEKEEVINQLISLHKSIISVFESDTKNE